MMRRLFLIFLVLSLLLTGCTPAAPTSSEGFCTFTDSTGAEVCVSEKPQTVAVLFSSFAQIWQLAGGTVSVTVGESVSRGFASEHAVLVDAGAGKTIDHELLLAARPDLVIGSADIKAHTDACRAASAAGIPAKRCLSP